jgi:aspartyl aminopeptidase
MSKYATAATSAQGFIDFVNAAVTPFHAVSLISARLRENGYQQLKETAEWPQLAPGGKFFITRNDASVVAFAIGGQFAPGNGFKIVGAHTDSPNLMLKPQPKLRKSGFAGLGVQTYGGGLWHTWFDRDLTIAGRVVLQAPDSARLESRLVHVKRPILRIPNLAIHLTTMKERESGFTPNKESHLAPFFATEGALGDLISAPEGQCPVLYKLLSDETGVQAENIVDLDISIVDTQPATVGGLHNEFIFAPRIDNLLSCHCALEAFLETDGSLAADAMVRMIAFFDHEEVGSESSHGAGGSLVPDVVERLSAADSIQRARSVANSFLLSVDCAHGVHPNYSDRHEENHRPKLHAGPVIKYNVNQRYSTSGETAAVIIALAKLADVPVQKFCVKNDSPCGSTIGPIMTALSGIRGVDIGSPMLSMHSIREMCGTVDIPHMVNLLKAFFTRYEEVRQV